jgi:predicted DNA-binding transcriptional regulator AlpA
MTARYLFTEDVAELTGISEPVIRKMLAVARRAHAENDVRPTHLPLPANYLRRKVFNGHHDVTTLSPRWRRSDINRWLKNRPGRGAPGVSRAKPAEPAGVGS